MAKLLSKEEFMIKATSLQKNIDLTKVNFVNTRTKVQVACKSCKKTWDILAKVLTTKEINCPYCSGRDRINSAYSDVPTTLYFIKVRNHDNTWLYKVGITKTNVQQRFSISDLRKIVIQKEIRYETGAEAYALEQRIHKAFEDHKYYGKPVLETHGNTELFTVDIYSILHNLKETK